MMANFMRAPTRESHQVPQQNRNHNRRCKEKHTSTHKYEQTLFAGVAIRVGKRRRLVRAKKGNEQTAQGGGEEENRKERPRREENGTKQRIATTSRLRVAASFLCAWVVDEKMWREPFQVAAAKFLNVGRAKSPSGSVWVDIASDQEPHLLLYSDYPPPTSPIHLQANAGCVNFATLHPVRVPS